MQILFVSATPFEIAPLRAYLEANFERLADFHFKKNGLEVKLLITGVGMPYTAFAMGTVLATQKVDLAVNAGVAGAFYRNLQIGEVVNVVSEQFGDLGVEEADGRFTDAAELGLIDAHQPPFINGKLYNPAASEFGFLPQKKGLTVNKVHGTKDSIAAVLEKYQADVESMEGAAFFLACLLSNVNFLEIRAISNYVEPRNREAWDIPLAIKNLNGVLVELVKTFQ
jgi:futalosine hydrolase